MPKLARNYRISPEVDQLLKSESARLSGEQGKKVSEADVIEMAVVEWCRNGFTTQPDTARTEQGGPLARDLVNDLSAQPKKKLSKKDRAIQDRAAQDVLAKAVGRDNIDYSDIDSTPTTHVAHLDAVAPPAGQGKVSMETWRQNRRPIEKPKDRK